jgi:hypothetical protein
LHGFKLGGKLLRISSEEVERYEREGACGTTDSESSKAGSSSFGRKGAVEGAIASARMIRPPLERRYGSSSELESISRHKSERRSQ